MRLGQIGHSRRQALAQHLFFAAAGGLGGGNQLRPVTGQAGNQLNLARLLQLLHREQLTLEQLLAALPFAAQLGQAIIQFGQGGLRLRTAGVGELTQGGAGFAQLGLLFIIVKRQQQIASLHPIAFAHQTLGDHTGDFAADLADRLAIDLTAGHHPLHQGLLLQAIARDLRAAPLLPGIAAEQQ